MSYQVFARKYRPQQFEDVIAQEHVTRTLKNAVKSGHLSSGYLFTGPRGTGKTTTARILAKALNCQAGPTPTPCDKCPACLEIISGSSLDVLEIDAASNTGVDDIRTLRENVRYMPTSGKKRVYIIDEVHRLSGSAFDALLKTLEEPPAHVVFIFATTEPFKVPETIRSRTQRYDFRRVAFNELTAHLRKIAENEKIEIDEAALISVVRKADGSVRDAVSLLDQMAAFCGTKIDGASVMAALGLIDRRVYFDFMNIIALRDCAGGLDLVKNLIDSGADLSEFASSLAEYIRNLLVAKNAVDPARLLELSESEMVSLKSQQENFSTGDLLRYFKLVTGLIIDLKSGLDPRLILETFTLRAASLDSTTSFEDILAHLSAGQGGDKKETGESGLLGLPASSKTGKTDIGGNLFTPAAPVTPAAVSSAETDVSLSISGGKVNLPIVQTSWKKFIEFMKARNQMVSSLLAMAQIKEVKDNVITAVFPTNGATKQVLEKPNYKEILLDALREFYRASLKITFEVDPSSKPPEEKKEKPEKIDTKKILAEDEALRQLVDRLDGDIIGRKKIEE